MSKKHATQFGAISFMALFGMGLAIYSHDRIWMIILYAWVHLVFAMVAVAYLEGKPRYLFKPYHGKRSIITWLIYFPYFALVYFSFWIYLLTHKKETAVAEAAPGVWFARRLSKTEVDKLNLHSLNILDLAAEFPAIRAESVTYHSEPMLDGAIPSRAQLDRAVNWINHMRESGPVLIHCALGHGRTGCVVLAWMVLQGQVADIDAGITKLKSLRKGFGTSLAQKQFVEQYVMDIQSQGHSSV